MLGTICQPGKVGRVERWRGGVGEPCVWPALSVAGARVAHLAPFPPPAHRTGRADRPHPALGSGSAASTWHGFTRDEFNQWKPQAGLERKELPGAAGPAATAGAPVTAYVLTQNGRISQPKTSSLIETQVGTLSAGIMADIGRKNRLFELACWRRASSITNLLIIGCVTKPTQNAKVIMSQSHLFS
jgi:hypothetical protein